MKTKRLLAATCFAIGVAATSHAQPAAAQQSLGPNLAMRCQSPGEKCESRY